MIFPGIANHLSPALGSPEALLLYIIIFKKKEAHLGKRLDEAKILM